MESTLIYCLATAQYIMSSNILMFFYAKGGQLAIIKNVEASPGSG